MNPGPDLLPRALIHQLVLASALLEAVQESAVALCDFAALSGDEQEMVVLELAVRRLKHARALARPEIPASEHAVNDGLALADLIGRDLHQLPPDRRAFALPAVLNCIAHAAHHGAEAAPASRTPSHIN